MTFSHFKKDWSRLINFDFITVVIWTKLFCEFKTHESFIIFVSCNFYTKNHWFFLKSFVKEKMISKKVFFCWAFWDHLKKISTLCILFVCRVKVHKPRQVISIHSYQQKSSPQKMFSSLNMGLRIWVPIYSNLSLGRGKIFLSTRSPSRNTLGLMFLSYVLTILCWYNWWWYIAANLFSLIRFYYLYLILTQTASSSFDSINTLKDEIYASSGISTSIP
jgi:hypothetical protein